MDIIEISGKNKGVIPLFSEVIIVDWYDGMVTGAAMLGYTDKWYLCNVCYFDPGKRQRIYTLIEASEQQIQQLRTFIQEDDERNKESYNKSVTEIRNAFNAYSGKAYLMKGRHLDDINFNVVEVLLSSLRFFDDVEDALNQDENSKQQWLGFFNE